MPRTDGDAPAGRVAFLVAPEGAEESELVQPWRAVVDAGATPTLVSTAPGEIQAFDHLDRAGSFPVDVVVDDELDASDFDALVLPGGVANPDHLRTQPAAVAFAGAFFDRGLPVAVICHGPWTLIEAGAVRGRTLTSYPSVRTDLVNAGAHWVDEKVVVCTNGPNTLVSSRRPDDLPDFCAALVTALEHAVATPS